MTGRAWVWWVVGVALALVAGVAQFGLWPGGQAPPAPLPSAPAALTPARATLDVGFDHTCRVESDGTVSCWGENQQGQLGTGARSPWSTRPVRVPGLESVVSVSAGSAHSCALTRAGDVHCWGLNASGQLGDGTTGGGGLPVRVAGLDGPAVAVSAGIGHTCAVTRDGAVWCWGSNDSGQLGDGRAFSAEWDPALDRRTAPVRVRGLTVPAVDVAAGLSSTCALTVAGGVECWGDNYWGQLGDGVGPMPEVKESDMPPDLRRSSPAPVAGLSGVVALSSGVQHACALTGAGRVWCWGMNDRGELGVDAPTARGVPGEVPGLPAGVTAISAGTHTCAQTGDGAVACWGPNDSGQLGDGTGARDRALDVEGPGPLSARPVAVAGLAAASGVSAGSSHTCATVAGSTTCWGSNSRGQLGDGTTRAHGGPVTVATPDTRVLTPRDVRVNVIVVDSALDVSRDVSEDQQAAAQELERRLVTQEPALLRAIEDTFRAATSGIFRPTAQVVRAATPLVLPGRSSCLDRFTHNERLQQVARPSRVEGIINIIAVRALICSAPDEGPWAGYGGDGMPVVGWLGMSSEQDLKYTMLHEYGHSEGLMHAGLSDCKGPAALRTCTTDEVGDMTSVMSYVHSSDVFTVPELHLMRLVDGHVAGVLDAPTTEFTLGTGGTTPAALVLYEAPGSHDNPVYVTGEAGRLEVRFVKTWEGTSSYGPTRSQTSLALVVWERPRPGLTIYTGTRGTLTYFGQDADGNAILRFKGPAQR